MKRILCAVLALVMIAGFAGCKQETAETEPILESSEEFTEETFEETEEETEETTEEVTEEETTEPTETTEETVPPCENHTWGYWVQLEAPTTSAEGKRVRTCTVCGTEDVEILEKLPKPSSHKHKYKTETSKSTCEEDGWVYYHCDCGDWYQVEEKAKGHTWGEWKITTPASADASGVKTRTCKVCKEKETEAVPYCKNHKWEKWTFKSLGDDTTLARGTRTCSVCHADDTEDIPRCEDGRHDFTMYRAAPSCGKVGHRYKACKNCGYKDPTFTVEEIPATQKHTWKAWEVLVPATPESSGKRKRTCSVCNTTEEEDIPLHTHNFQFVVTKEATCTEDGLKEGLCATCKLKGSETIPALGHDFGTDGICTRCKKTKEEAGTTSNQEAT